MRELGADQLKTALLEHVLCKSKKAFDDGVWLHQRERAEAAIAA